MHFNKAGQKFLQRASFHWGMPNLRNQNITWRWFNSEAFAAQPRQGSDGTLAADPSPPPRRGFALPAPRPLASCRPAPPAPLAPALLGSSGSPSAADTEPEPATVAEPDMLEPWLPRLPVSWLAFSPPGRLKGSPELANIAPRTGSRTEPRLTGRQLRAPQAARPERGFRSSAFQHSPEQTPSSSPPRVVIVFPHTPPTLIL